MEPVGDNTNNDVSNGIIENNDVIFRSEEEMLKSLSRFCYGDLYTIGLIWIYALRTVLVGTDFSLFPVVAAAKPPEPPKKPPKMRYKDLPIYETPHYDFKEHEISKISCPGANTKLLQKALLPHVMKMRMKSQEAICKAHCCFKNTCKALCESINASKSDFKKTMRDPNKLEMRQGVVVGGTMVGYLIGCGGGIPRRAFFTGLGALASGALCFPKETDEVFRNISYHTAKMALTCYNGLCGKNYELRERIPCKDDLPAEPKPRKPVCQPK